MEWRKKIIYGWQSFGESIIRNVFEMSNVDLDGEGINKMFRKILNQLELIGQDTSVDYFIGKSICFELRKSGYFVNTYTICTLVSKFIGEAKNSNVARLQA